MAADYSSQVLADAPVGYWRLGETIGTTAVDASGNGRHGTYVGGVTLGVPGLLVDDADTAAAFDGGLTTRVDIPFNPEVLVGPGDFTIETLFRIDDLANAASGRHHGLIGPESLEPRFQVTVLRTTGQLFVGVGSRTWTTPFVVSEGVPYLVHVRREKAANRLSLYVNGEFVAEDVHAASSAPLPTSNRRLADALNGVQDDTAIYPLALSPTRIQAHYIVGLMLSRAYRKLMGVGM